MPQDFDCLIGVMQSFRQVVTTPSILTEVSNFLGQPPQGLRLSLLQRLSFGIQRLREDFTPSVELVRESCFPRFGLTDAGIVHSARGRFLVLTDDFRLAGYLQRHEIDVVNFNHLRTAYLLGG
jgi:hypothetical protein